MKIVWYCPICNHVSVSDSKLHHCVDYCECGNAGMDLEEYGIRVMGDIVKLAVFKDGKWTRKRG